MTVDAPGPRGDRKRVFFALWPDADTVRRLHRQARAAREVCGGRLMRADTLHMTLFFIGDVCPQRLAGMMDAADNVVGEAFEMRIDISARWGHNRIVWAGMSAPPGELLQLHENLSRVLREAGCRPEPQPFKPHITLLRNTLQPPAESSMVAIRWRVGEFALIASMPDHNGANYHRLKDWPLRKVCA